MVLSRLTKITGPGVSTDTNWVGNNADFTGITTSGTSFNIGVTTIHSNLIEAHNIKSTGILTATGGSFSGNVTAVDGTFSGNVSIAGTLTYEDLTNIDSVGLVTAREGIHIPDNKRLDFGGTAGSGDFEIRHTSGNSFIENNTGAFFISQSTGAANSPLTIHGGNELRLKHYYSNGGQLDAIKSVRGYQTEIYWQGQKKIETTSKGVLVGTGVTIETNGQTYSTGISTTTENFYIKPDTQQNRGIYIGSNSQLRLQYTGSANQSYLKSTAAFLSIASNQTHIQRADTNYTLASFSTTDCSLRYAYVKKIETTSSGINVIGVTTTTGLAVTGVSTFTGAIDANGDLDVDGHTNLDNVNIAGVTTSTGNIYADNYFANSGLTLNNNGNPSVNITSTSTTGSSRINFGDPDSNSVGLIHYVHDGDYLKFQTAYGERLRIGSAGQLGIGGANYGSSGQVLTSGGSGATVSWSTITGTTINNNADNRIITGSGTANTLEGESLLTFDGNVLLVASNSYNILEMRADENNDGGNDDNILKFTHDGTFRAEMRYDQSSSTLELSTSDNRGDLVIDTSGKVSVGGTFEVGHHQPADGSSAARAAKSALEIKKHYPQKTSGNYWIIDRNGTAREIYCEMETDGGGWMLWHDHNAPGSKTSMNIALGGSDASPSSNLSRSHYNNYAYYTVWIKASQIDATGERLHSFVTLDANGALKYVADYGSDFLLEHVGDLYQPNLNAYFNDASTGEYVANTEMYQPQCGATGWESFSNGGWSEVYIREMDTRISPGTHRSLHLVERIYNFDANGVPFWILAESMHPTPHWSDISLIQGEAADGQNPNIQTHNVEINSMNGNNGPSIRARSRGVLTGTFEYTFQLGYNWGWSIACLNATIGIENAMKDQSSDPYSAYTQPYYHASLYNNSSNNLWYPTSRAPWQNSDTSSSHSPGINYGNHVLWRESDGTIKARDKSGTHSNYTFPIKFAGPLILCSGSQSPHYTKLQSVWNTGNTYDGVSAVSGRNRWYK